MKIEPTKVPTTNEIQPVKFRGAVLGLLALSGTLAPLTNTIYLPAIPNIQNELEASPGSLDLIVSSFIFLYGICPLVWSGWADRYGRRTPYLSFSIIFAIGSLGCALATDVTTLFIMHMIQGVGSSATLVLGVGTVTDIFPNETRGRALSVTYLGPVIGLLIGPILGGVITQHSHWRTIFWLLMGIGLFIFLCSIFIFPETLKNPLPPPLTFNFQDRKFITGPLFNPFEPLGLFRYPIYLLGCLAIGLSGIGLMFVMTTLPRTLPKVYGIAPSELGLISTLPGLGSMLGNFISGYISDRNSRTPESRLRWLWVGSLILTGGLLLHGWCLHSTLPKPALLFALFLVGLGSMWTLLGCMTYISNIQPTVSTMAAALGGFSRTLISSLTTSFNTPLLQSLGLLNSSILYAGLALLSFLILIGLSQFGPNIRNRTGPKGPKGPKFNRPTSLNSSHSRPPSIIANAV